MLPSRLVLHEDNKISLDAKETYRVKYLGQETHIARVTCLRKTLAQERVVRGG